MKIVVNEEELVVFQGATVADVIRVYYVKHNQPLPAHKPNVKDAYGNCVALDGELNDGNHLYIKITGKE